MKKAILYIHGKGGSTQEAQRFQGLCPNYDVYGADYTAGTPWEAKAPIRAAYDRLAGKYPAVLILANSIGAYFAMLALADVPMEKALFISPIVDMEKLIRDMMLWANVSEETLRQQGEIETSFGETLSWQYLQYVRSHPIRWTVPTCILYAGKDHLTSRETVSAFAEAHNASLTVMEDGEHWFHTEHQLAFLDAWLREHL